MPRTPDFKINRSIPDLISDIRRPQVPPETGWHEVGISDEFHRDIPFQNSWNQAGGTHAPASHYLSEDGELRSRGVVTGGSINTVIYTVPEELRPEYPELYLVPLEDTEGNVTAGSVRIETSGDVVYLGPIFPIETTGTGGTEVPGAGTDSILYNKHPQSGAWLYVETTGQRTGGAGLELKASGTGGMRLVSTNKIYMSATNGFDLYGPYFYWENVEAGNNTFMWVDEFSFEFNSPEIGNAYFLARTGDSTFFMSDNTGPAIEFVARGGGFYAEVPGFAEFIFTGPAGSGFEVTTEKIGFFGVNPVVQQAAPDTVEEIVDALENLGLVALGGGAGGGGGGSVATDTIWDAAGDLAVGSGADAASRLPIGVTNGHVLTVDSAEPLKMKWAAAPGGSVATDVIWDAKGDIAAGTGADAADNLAVGSNDKVLLADSTQATGLRWGDIDGGSA